MADSMEKETLAKPEPVALGIPRISLEGPPLSQVTTDDYDPTSHPASPFYSHPTTKTSFEQLKKDGSATRLSAYETDLEAGSTRPSCEEERSKTLTTTTTNTNTPQKECTVWPRRQILQMQYKERKRQRTCYPWNTLSKKQKLAAKIATLLLIIAIGVAIGVGVSKAVGGTWYQSANQQSKVGAPPTAS